MAIFMASTKSISRAKGQNAIAAAAYRAGDKLLDEDKEKGKTHDYEKRSGVLSADIILPSDLSDSEIGRAELWNMAERHETRKNSRVAREWLVALPHELSEPDRKALAHDFARTLANRYQVIADCAIHVPTDKEIERGASPLNFHAHILLTTRTASIDDDGKIYLTKDKADSEISDDDRRKKGLPRMSVEVKAVRELWEQSANKKLEEYGHNLIDSRSYRSQGIELVPQIKMGKDATHMERKGKSTVKGDFNRDIIKSNELVWDKQLATNQRMNKQADQIIFERRKQKERDYIPEPTAKITKIEPKPIPVQSAAVMQALALAKTVKQKHLDQAKDKALVLAAELRSKQEQEQQAKLAQQQLAAVQIERETAQFNANKEQRYAQALSSTEKHHIKGIDTNTQQGHLILSISVANEALNSLNDY
ncbi:MAG: MobA/MobL family protein, partial [Clostridiaceae bacterium]|nr:MobA/MobL family protein [Clostridiaceae bacterium]